MSKFIVSDGEIYWEFNITYQERSQVSREEDWEGEKLISWKESYSPACRRSQLKRQPTLTFFYKIWRRLCQMINPQ